MRQSRGQLVTLTWCFNPRTHTGCDNDCRPAYPVPWCFNPRTHTGCDRPPVVLSANPSSFQSTHPHGVRPAVRRGHCKAVGVSIHAPTRGATSYGRLKISHGFEFQSTHPHGVRQNGLAKVAEQYVFQSTHPHGVRLNACQKAIHQFIVSIHAPTRGATML